MSDDFNKLLEKELKEYIDEIESDIIIPIYNNKKKNSCKNKLTTLLLSGGAMKSIQFCGLLKGLEICNQLKNINHIIGVSGGAMILFFFCLGYTVDDIIKINIKLDFTKILSISLKNIKSGSLDNGENLERIMKIFIKNKGFNENITFSELYKINKIQFDIHVNNINENKLEIMNYKTSPNLEIYKAIRMTSAIPILFEPVEYNGHLYNDAGVADNFPISYYEHKLKNLIGGKFKTTLFESSKSKTIENYIISIINGMNKKADSQYNIYSDYFVDFDCSIGTLDFSASKELRLKNIKIGCYDTIQHICKRFN